MVQVPTLAVKQVQWLWINNILLLPNPTSTFQQAFTCKASNRHSRSCLADAHSEMLPEAFTAASRRPPLTARRWNGRWQIVVDFLCPSYSQPRLHHHHNSANFKTLPLGTLASSSSSIYFSLQMTHTQNWRHSLSTAPGIAWKEEEKNWRHTKKCNKMRVYYSIITNVNGCRDRKCFRNSNSFFTHKNIIHTFNYTQLISITFRSIATLRSQ